MTYEQFIADLRRLVRDAESLRTAEASDGSAGSAAFRKWRSEAQATVANAGRQFELPGPFDSTRRNYRETWDGATHKQNRAAFNRDVDDSLNELRFLIDQFDRYGKPSRNVVRKELLPPDKFTLGWIWDHAPIGAWLWFIGLLITAFGLGYGARVAIESLQHPNSPPATLESGVKSQTQPQTTSKPTRGPITLRELFESDWRTHYPGYYQTGDLESESFTNGKIPIAWRINGDFDSRVRFLAFFLDPFVSPGDATEVCRYMANHYQDYIDTEDVNVDVIGRGPADTAGTHMRDMKFSGSFFLYYDNPDFSSTMKGALENLYHQKGLSIKFRDDSYEWSHHEDPPPQKRLVPNSVLVPDANSIPGWIIVVKKLR